MLKRTRVRDRGRDWDAATVGSGRSGSSCHDDSTVSDDSDALTGTAVSDDTTPTGTVAVSDDSDALTRTVVSDDSLTGTAVNDDTTPTGTVVSTDSDSESEEAPLDTIFLEDDTPPGSLVRGADSESEYAGSDSGWGSISSHSRASPGDLDSESDCSSDSVDIPGYDDLYDDFDDNLRLRGAASSVGIDEANVVDQAARFPLTATPGSGTALFLEESKLFNAGRHSLLRGSTLTFYGHGQTSANTFVRARCCVGTEIASPCFAVDVMLHNNLLSFRHNYCTWNKHRQRRCQHGTLCCSGRPDYGARSLRPGPSWRIG